MEQNLSIVREAVTTFTPSKVLQRDLPKIASSQNAYDIVKNFYDETMNYVEQFSVILLNRNNRVLGVKVVSLGGVSGTIADPKVIFCSAISALASAIIVVHNHPSGNLTPSESDNHLTKKLVNGGTLLDIRVLDHLIITEDGYYSYADSETL